MPETNIESSLKEQRIFPPSAEFSSRAHIKSAADYEGIRKRAADNPEEYWAEVASELHWFERWKRFRVDRFSNGSSAAGPTFPITASIAISTPPERTGSPFSRKGPVTFEPSPIKCFTAKSASSPTYSSPGTAEEIAPPSIWDGAELAVTMLACARIGVTLTSSSAVSARSPADRIGDSRHGC